ncbi:MAG TPA: hypothetical protein VNJ46_00105 [Gaiellaceae bacterium]|nr:hypothetical protein [Gaiellaceae bacterium]
MTKEEAVEIARARAGFEPCAQRGCVQVRFLRRGVPARGFWLVGLRSTLEERPRARVAVFLVDARTGEVSRA